MEYVYVRLRRISNLVRLDEGEERKKEKEGEKRGSQPLSAPLRVHFVSI